MQDDLGPERTEYILHGITLVDAHRGVPAANTSCSAASLGPSGPSSRHVGRPPARAR